MKRKFAKRLGATAILVAAAAFVVGNGGGTRFCLRGRFVTDDVIVRNGEMYVPVSALARSMGLSVRSNGATCDLVPGAVRPFRFEVLSVERATGYRAHLGFNDYSVDAAPGRELIVATCRLRNDSGLPQSIELYNDRDTRLSDASFRSFAPATGNRATSFNGRAPLLAGASVDFSLKFEVPKGFQPDRLTFSVQNSPGEAPVNLTVSLRSR